MSTKDLFRQQAYLVIFIFLANFLANRFHLYYSIWWFDVFMHFTGGVWLGMVFVWFLKKRNLPMTFDFSFIFKLTAWLLLVGIGWEVFEFYFINHMAGYSFDRFDTVSDLLLDVSGGVLVALYFSRKDSGNKVELQ